MQRTSFLVAVLCLAFCALKAQDSPSSSENSILPASPTASELGRYGQFPVGMFSGAASYSIPLYELKGRAISLPISLSYSSNGVRLDQVASWVGMSWSLNAGGVITRTIMDEPDETNHDITPLGVDNFDAWEMSNFVHTVEDTEPDIYAFNFMGYTGKFVQSKNDYKFYVVPYSNFKIKETSYPEGNGFKITTPDGIQYFFDVKEISRTETACSDDDHTQNRATSWFLARIVHPTGEEIRLTYKSAALFYYSGVSESNSTLSVSSCDACVPPPQQQEGCRTLSYTSTWYLDSIYNQSVTIKFNSSTDRLDLVDHKLDEILIKERSTNSIIRSFVFDYLFAKKEEPSPSLSLYLKNTYYRMFLQSITEKGALGTTKPSYRFEYIEPDELPKRLSYSQDHWGYYNGEHNSNLTPITEFEKQPVAIPMGTLANSFPHLTSVNREAHFPFTQKGMLKRIIFPTGGVTEVEYEANTSVYLGEAGGVRVKKVTQQANYGQPPIIERYTYGSPANSQIPTYLNYSFGLCDGDSPGSISCIYPTLSSNSARNLYASGNAVVYSNVTKSLGDSNTNGREEYSYIWVSADEPGTLEFGLYGYPSEAPQFTQSFLSWSPYTNYGWNAGQMISKVVFDGSNQKKYEERYTYNGKQGAPSIGYLINTEDLRNGTDVVAFHVRKRFDWGLGAGVVPRWYTCEAEDVTDIKHGCYQKQPGVAIQVAEFTNFDILEYRTLSRWGYLKSKEVVNYELDPLNPISIKTDYLYDNPEHAQITREQTIGSDGTLVETRSAYPQDYTSVSNFGALIDVKFILDKPVDIRKYKNSRLVEGTQILYNDNGQPITVFRANAGASNVSVDPNNPYTFTFSESNQYDSKGLLVENHKRSGLTTTYLWSYKNTLPVAKIDNLSHDAVVQSLGSTFVSMLGDQYLGSAVENNLSTLRQQLEATHSSSYISTFSYYPGVGVKEMTDINGISSTFEYDDLGRLRNTKDNEDNITSAYSYHYASPENIPSLAVSPQSLNFAYESSQKTFSIQAPGAWSITENLDWLSVSMASGNGNSTITVQIDENAAFTTRTGSITISAVDVSPEVVISISQFAHPNYVLVNRNNLIYTGVAESKTFEISSTVAWQITKDQNWFNISQSSGSGNGTVTVTVLENTAFIERTGIITIHDASQHGSPDQYIAVSQDGALSFLNVSSTALHFDASGSSKTFQISSNVGWSISDNASWVTLNPASGNGTGTITVTASSNTASSSRSGLISITDLSGAGHSQQVVVDQAGTSNYITLSTTNIYLNSSNIDATFDIFSNATSWNTRIIYQNGSDWLDDIYPSGGFGNRDDIDIHVNQLPPSGQTWQADIEVYNVSLSLSAKVHVTVSN